MRRKVVRPEWRRWAAGRMPAERSGWKPELRRGGVEVLGAIFWEINAKTKEFKLTDMGEVLKNIGFHMARSKNVAGTVTITVSTTAEVKQYLELLASGGLYGKNAAEAANFLLSESLRKLVRAGTLPAVLPEGAASEKE